MRNYTSQQKSATDLKEAFFWGNKTSLQNTLAWAVVMKWLTPEPTSQKRFRFVQFWFVQLFRFSVFI